MASSSSSVLLLCFLFLLSLSSFISSSPQNLPTTIVIPLHQHSTQTPSSDPWKILNNLASTSLSRAKHIKNPHKTHLSKTQLSPQSYGGYSVSLSFGTPPQTIPFVMDTGSDLVWFPCTDHYICRNCSFSNSNSNGISYYKPKLSSSSKLIGCQNTKCGWIHKSDVQSRCQDCLPNSKNCTQICPPYLLLYGSGSTAGLLLSETLNLNNQKVPNFVVGCSRFSLRIPTGIVGFGRGPASLPTQLGLNKFSYCLLSHRFDNSKESSQLVLYSGSDSGDTKTTGVSYTPLIKNPVDRKPGFSVYYYVGLRKITVGGKKVKIPYKYLSLASDGNGGTIVDSGSTFTFMEGRIFELVTSEIVKQVAHYRRASDVEASSGLKPCFKLPEEGKIELPKLSFHFKGGAEMDLPLANYFSFVGNSKVVCLTIVTNSADSAGDSDGPSVILGNYQQQNYYVEYDLKNERFGFRQHTCKVGRLADGRGINDCCFFTFEYCSTCATSAIFGPL